MRVYSSGPWSCHTIHMKLPKKVDTPEAAYARYTAAGTRFRWYLVFVSLVVIFWVALAVQGVRHELLSRSPDNQTISAIATSTRHVCTKGGCYYESYGHYTIDGQYEDNVKLGAWNYPMTGQIGVRVNPTEPRFAMDLYQQSYLPQIIIPAALATFFLGLEILLFCLFKQRGRHVAAALMTAGRNNSRSGSA
jgi:hypothetical protein